MSIGRPERRRLSRMATSLFFVVALHTLPTVTCSTSPNPVGALVGYVVSSVTKTIDGVGELWSNHGRCNEIRKKMSVHRNSIKSEWEEQDGILTSLQKEQLKKMQGGISFEEYVFLQKGKEDRGKVLNLVFLMWGAPKFLPYALLFNPSIMPSPFKAAPADGGDSLWAIQSRQRSAAVLQALVSLEQASNELYASGFSLAKMNIFGKKEQAKQQKQLVAMTDSCTRMMTDPSVCGRIGAEKILESLPEGWLYKRSVHVDVNEDETVSDIVITDFDRGEKRLSLVPKPVVKGLANVLSGGSAGIFAGIQPHFLTRGRLLGHITKVEQADEFLTGAKIDLDTISKQLLKEACSDRFYDSPAASEEELREQLATWLELTVHEPALKLKRSEALYYNGNLARMALMAYNSLISTRAPSSASTLPRLLYTGKAAGDDESDKKHGRRSRNR
ncbi:hypothetical protein MPSEU_000094900 [Mayamaea pseudoterrestris]|nr:hypothetical protein MPSEU_000094900 [Mayamaea pseudoterrestris]